MISRVEMERPRSDGAFFQAQLVGDFLGDNATQVNVTLAGSAVTRTCDTDNLQSWSLGKGVSLDGGAIAVVQGGVNPFGDAPPNQSLAGQSVARSTWRVTVPGSASAPSNSDVDLTKLEDIVQGATSRVTETHEPPQREHRVPDERARKGGCASRSPPWQVSRARLGTERGRWATARPGGRHRSHQNQHSQGARFDCRLGPSTYRHGGLMTGIEHIMYRHSAGSEFANVSRYAEGATARNIVSYVDDALRYGGVTPNGAGVAMVEHDLGKAIGTNIAGDTASSIRVFVRGGVIQTAFPF